MAVLSVETKKISELDAALAVNGGDNFIVDTAANGTRKATFSAILASLKSELNVPASANTLLSNESISSTYENSASKVASSASVYTAEQRLTNAEKDLLFMQGAVAYNTEWTLANLLTAIRSDNPKAYSLGDYITVNSKKWVVVAKNYYTSYNIPTYKPHAVLMMSDVIDPTGRVYNTANTNAGGYNGSELKTYLENTFYNTLPSALRSAIIAVQKVQESTKGALAEFTRSIQLPSVMQLTGSAQRAESQRSFGPPFACTGNAQFLCGEGSYYYWTNVPVDDSTTNFCYYTADRQFVSSGQARYAQGVRPFVVIG